MDGFSFKFICSERTTMTQQRFSNIEDAILNGLLDAPTHNDPPFKIDPSVFTTSFKRKIAVTINKYIDQKEPFLAKFNLENAIDDDAGLQHEWITMQGNSAKLGFSLPVSVLKRYYETLIADRNMKIIQGGL